ncbi:MAG: hypothetical protein ACXVB1_14480 [Pseudobdellovibrionaceae bacterium]
MNQLPGPIKHLISAAIICLSLNASSHGEDKLGPNGGYIQMPGAYHTELVPDGPHKLKVFFLDISWKTQALNNSNLQIKYVGKKSSSNANCEPQGKTYFSCTFPNDADLSKPGKLIVNSQHEGQKGNEVMYKLPLKLQATDESHGKHH